MYNSIIKENFLNDRYSEPAAKQYQYLFEKIAIVEENQEKDIYKFNCSELLEVFQKLKIKNDRQKIIYKGMLSNYIQWCIDKEIKNENENLVKTLEF